MRSVGITENMIKFLNLHTFKNFSRRVITHIFFLCSWIPQRKEKKMYPDWFLIRSLAFTWLNHGVKKEIFSAGSIPNQSHVKNSQVTHGSRLHLLPDKCTQEHVQIRWQSLTRAPCNHLREVCSTKALFWQSTRTDTYPVRSQHTKGQLVSSQGCTENRTKSKSSSPWAATEQTSFRHKEKLLTIKRIQQRSPK